MTKRTIEIKVRLNQKEADQLNDRVRKSGLSREAYIRQLCSGYRPRDASPPDYFAMMRELYGIGRNLNQIAQKAHVLKVVDLEFPQKTNPLRCNFAKEFTPDNTPEYASAPDLV